MTKTKTKKDEPGRSEPIGIVRDPRAYPGALMSDGTRQLPSVWGWTVDLRMSEFRRIDPRKGLITIPLHSPEGEVLFAAFLREWYGRRKGL